MKNIFSKSWNQEIHLIKISEIKNSKQSLLLYLLVGGWGGADGKLVGGGGAGGLTGKGGGGGKELGGKGGGGGRVTPVEVTIVAEDIGIEGGGGNPGGGSDGGGATMCVGIGNGPPAVGGASAKSWWGRSAWERGFWAANKRSEKRKRVSMSKDSGAHKL